MAAPAHKTRKELTEKEIPEITNMAIIMTPRNPGIANVKPNWQKYPMGNNQDRSDV